MRGEIAALTARIDVVEGSHAPAGDGPDGEGALDPSALAGRLSQLDERSRHALTAANKRIDWLETLVYAQEATGTAGTPDQAPHRHGPRPALRPPLGWTVLHAEQGVAVLSGKNGAIDVTPGIVVPELGRVEDIRQEGNRWIVVTESGVIRQR